MDALVKFRELARDFRSAAEGGDLSRMEAILAQRRGLVERISAEEGDHPDGAGSESRRNLLEAILELDRQSEAILRRMHDDLGVELMGLDAGRRGLAGYAGGPGRSAKWIDEQG